MRKSKSPEDTQDLTDLLPPAAEETSSEASAEDKAVNIPLEDVTVKVTEVHVQPVEQPPAAPDLSDVVKATLAMREKIQREADEKMAAWSRSSEKRRGESDIDHNNRIKAAFESAVMAARRQAEMPEPPPQPVPPAISEQTRKEMAAGAKQSAFWAEQQKARPMPTAKEIAEAGANTPVFRPGEYMHEKGGIDKHLVTQSMPGR
jgi:hypothetical protein